MTTMTMHPLVWGSNCLAGMHPDECTEDILGVVLHYGKLVAIVPCCVFPCLFPHRTRKGRGGPGGAGEAAVQTYDEFVQYLLKKDGRLRRETLEFEGKNVSSLLPERFVRLGSSCASLVGGTVNQGLPAHVVLFQSSYLLRFHKQQCH